MTRRNIKETTSKDLGIQYVHDGMAEIDCCTYFITKLIKSNKGGALFGKPTAELRCPLSGSLRLVPVLSSG